MSGNRLEALRELLDEELDGVSLTPDGLRATVDARWGELTVEIDPDADEADDDTIALRVQVRVPSPIGAGREFLVFCLAANVEYWGAKIGVDESGMLSVHADVETDREASLVLLADEIVARVESITQLLDDDLAGYCMTHGLGTPAQRARWLGRATPPAAGDDDDDED